MQNIKPICSILFLVIVGVTQSCNDSIIKSPEKYVNYLKENAEDISDSVVINGLQISVTYLPVEFLALNAYGQEEFTKNPEQILKEYEGMEYYEYDISKPDSKTLDYLKEHYNNLHATEFDTYFNFSIQKDFILVFGTDTIQCGYLHREISDAITNKVKYTLAFSLQNISGLLMTDRKIILNSDKFNLRHVLLTISSNQIESLPQLKIK